MNILFLFLSLTAFQHHSNHILKAENPQERISQTKDLKDDSLETYTTILLDDEAFSIVSDTKQLRTRYDKKHISRKGPSTKTMNNIGRHNSLFKANKAKKDHMFRANNTNSNKRHRNIFTTSQNKRGHLKNKDSKNFLNLSTGKPWKYQKFHAFEHSTINSANTDFIKKKLKYQAKPKRPRAKNSSLGIHKNNIIRTGESEENSGQSRIKPSLTISISKNDNLVHEGNNVTNKEKAESFTYKPVHITKKSKRHFVSKNSYNRRNRETTKEFGTKLRYYPTAEVMRMTARNFDGNISNTVVVKRINFARKDSDISSDISESMFLTTQYSISGAYDSDSIDRTLENKPHENNLFVQKIPFKSYNNNVHYKTNEVVTKSNRNLANDREQRNEPPVTMRSFESTEQNSSTQKVNYWNAPSENLPKEFEVSINNSAGNTEPNYYGNGKPLSPSTIFWRAQTDPPVYNGTFRQADIVQRNLLNFSLENPKHEKSDNLSDESDLDDTVITFGGACDETDNHTCWVQREVGDVLTLAVKIESSEKPSSFQIRWMKSYHVFESKKEKLLEIEPGKLPWNMVSGSEGRELRLNPVSNTDIDPNCFIATVFYLNKNRGKTLFTELKKLIFRIDISIIDMGKVYAGEELSINVENFISLPERGNLVFEWNLETRPHQYEALPSNVKVSNSGRSVVLKELKKGRLGILNCVIYSPSRYAIAKRRFNILNIADNNRRRSVVINSEGEAVTGNWLRSKRCRHIMRRSQERALQKLKEGTKPKTRKKRFKRMEPSLSHYSNFDCEPLRKKVYSRWLRWALAGDGETTTEDPRLMPIEKLFLLSEEGDGTLDDMIPRETHVVVPEVRLVTGTSVESKIVYPYTPNCTSDSDCDENAYCYHLVEEAVNTTASEAYCICHQEYYRYGKKCIEIPLSNQRRKRLKREFRNDFAVPHHLFYDHGRESSAITPKTVEISFPQHRAFDPISPRSLLKHITLPPLIYTIRNAVHDNGLNFLISQNGINITSSTKKSRHQTINLKEETERDIEPPKILAFEEEESFLLSDCIDDRDCSMHANCVQPSNGHPYCKCRPGYRGNGIFCWEIIDYVPPEENFLTGDNDMNAREPTAMPVLSKNYLALRTPEAEELEEQ